MNRTQRRRAEKESRKNEIRLTPDRIHEIKQDVTDRAIRVASEDLMTCFMYVMRKRFGFGEKRMLIALREIDALMGMINDEPEYMDEVKQVLRDEVGLEIKY